MAKTIKYNEEQLTKIKNSIEIINNKKSKFLFSVPQIETPSALIYEIYFHAHVIEKMGYEVNILTDDDFSVPDYIEDELTNKTHKKMNKAKLSVGPHDVMVIPEIHTNVMEVTKDLPCKRIMLLQSIDYLFNALIPGSTPNDFGITEILTTSETLKDLINLYFDTQKFNIQYYDLGIPDYFNDDKRPKKPIVSIVGRNPNEISKFVKLFYTKYPQYRWITFDAMLSNSKPPRPLIRTDFAEKLKSNFAGVWIDRISSFGTFPLECIKGGVIPICLKPDITPDYLIDKEKSIDGNFYAKENLGIWTKDYYDLPLLLNDVLTRFLDDSIPNEIYETMKKESLNYTQENSSKQLEEIYGGYLNERKNQLEELIKNNKMEE